MGTGDFCKPDTNSKIVDSTCPVLTDSQGPAEFEEEEEEKAELGTRVRKQPGMAYQLQGKQPCTPVSLNTTSQK